MFLVDVNVVFHGWVAFITDFVSEKTNDEELNGWYGLGPFVFCRGECCGLLLV